MGTSCCTKRTKNSIISSMDNKFLKNDNLNDNIGLSNNPISFKNFKENNGFISKGNSFDIVNNELLFRYHKEFSHHKEYKNYYKEDQKLHYKNMKNKNQKTVKNLKHSISFIEMKLLGSGSSGTIIKAFDKKNNLILAVKKIFLGNLNDEEIKLVEKEANILFEIVHKNIVKFYGSKRKKDILEIYFEYVENQSLRDLLKKKKKLSESKTSKYLKQILQALDYLHSKELIHRDIKAENILLNRNSEIKLSDFGSATNSKNENFSVVGTVGFIAPEVLENKNGYGRYADIWSLGCTVFELLTGNSPFKGTNIYKSTKIILDFDDEYLFLESEKIGVLAKDFIKCCIKKNPKLRHNSFELLNHPFLKHYDNVFYNHTTKEYKDESILRDKTSCDLNKFKIKTLNEVCSLYSINSPYIKKDKMSKKNSEKINEIIDKKKNKNLKVENNNNHGYLITLESEYIN